MSLPPPSRPRRLGRALLRLEPLLVLLLTPLAWWPDPATPVAFAIVPVLWLLRRRLTGRWTVRTVFDFPAIVLLLSLPLLILTLNGGPPRPAPGFTPTAIAKDAGKPTVIRRGQPVAPQVYDHQDVNQGTLSLWVKPLGWSGDDGLVHDILSHESQRWVLYKHGSNRLDFHEPGAGGLIAAPITGASFAADTWHHLAVVWDADESVDGSGYAVLYLDGTIVGRRAARFTPVAWDDLVVGNTRDGTHPGRVEVEGLTHWDRPLAVAEVRELYAAGRRGGSASFADASVKFLQVPGDNRDEFLTFPRRRINQVADGLMEQAGTAAFEPVGSPLEVAKSTARVFGDRQSLHVVGAGPAPSGVRQRLALEAGRGYALSAWVYVARGAVRIEVAGTEAEPARSFQNLEAAGGWQPVAFGFDAGTASTLRLLGLGSADFSVDNLAVVPSLIANGGLEGDDGQGVAPNWRVDGQAAVRAETAAVHSGSRAQLVGFSGCDGQSLSQAVSGLEAGAWYALSAWLQSPSGASALGAQVDTARPTSGAFAAEAGRWSRRSLVFQATANAHTVSWRPICDGDRRANDAFLIDDVALVPLQPLAATWAADLWEAPGHGHGGEDRRIWSLLLGLALLYAIANAATGEDVGRRYLPALALVAVVVAGAALPLTEPSWGDKGLPLTGVQYGLPRLSVRLVEGTRGGGIGTNELGGMLAVLLPVALGTALGARGAWRWRLFAASAGLAGALLLVQSRSGFFGAAVGVLLLVAWRWRRVGVLLLPAMAVAGAVWALGSTAALPDPLAGRVDLWARAVRILQDHVLFGIGIGRFDLAYAAYYASPVDPEPLQAHAHNFWLQAWLDLGILGGLAYSALFVAALVGCWRLARQDRSPAQWAGVTLAAGIVATFVFGLTDTIAPGARGGLFSWAIFGLIAALGRRPAVETALGDGRRPVSGQELAVERRSPASRDQLAGEVVE